MADRDEDLIGNLAALVAAVLDGDMPEAGTLAGHLTMRLGATRPAVAGVEAELRAALRFDPAGLAEITAMTGETKQSLNYLMGAPGSPRPVHLARMKVWRRSEVAVWWASIGREVSWTDTPEEGRQ